MQRLCLSAIRNVASYGSIKMVYTGSKPRYLRNRTVDGSNKHLPTAQILKCSLLFDFCFPAIAKKRKKKLKKTTKKKNDLRFKYQHLVGSPFPISTLLFLTAEKYARLKWLSKTTCSLHRTSYILYIFRYPGITRKIHNLIQKFIAIIKALMLYFHNYLVIQKKQNLFHGREAAKIETQLL